MRKKIISCLLALAMVFSVLQGTGVPVKADPGAEESNAVTVNAGYYAMKVTDTDVSQRIVKTLDAMITAGKNNIFLTEDDDTHKSYLISIIEEMPTADLYDFGVSFDKNSKICTVKYNSQSRNINAFKTTLDCSAAEGDGVYSAITFCTYVAVYFSGEIEEKEGAYFSKSIDGTVYASQLEEPYFPNLSDEMPYHVPYGGKLSDIIAPELYAGDMADKIESEFVCFPVVTWQGNYYNTWYLDINDPDKKTKVTADTTFTKLENFISVSFTEPHVHSYPATTNTESDYVIWHWGTADKEYKDTCVEILCTDADCPAEDNGLITIQNTDVITDSVVVNKETTDPTCTKDGEITYTATAKYVENDTTYTYTSTKTIDGDKATGHQWEFDTADANAVWNDDNTTVTIKKTCTDTSHDTEEDGAVEVSVSSSNISNEVIAATKCGEASKRVYTATFDSSVDPAIGTSFTVTKTVTGDILLHDWIFDTENAIWEGNDSDGYTKATITKKCKNTVHDGDNNITVSSTKIEKNVEPATEEDNTERTYYTAIFNSENDKDITNEFTVKKVVTKQIMPGCEFNVTSDVVWEKDEQGGYKSVTISKNFINSVTGNIEKTERVKSAIIESSVKAATECEQPSITTYTATFDNTVDPDIKTAFTVSFDVKGEILEHDWEYDTENAVLSQEGQEGQERYLITIKKTCNNKEHTGVNLVPVTSDKVTISTGAAITCGEHTTITYTATFDSTVDSDIAEAFDVEIEAEGPILQHNWEYVIDSQKAYWVGSESDGYTAVSIEKICTNPEHSKDTIVLCTSKKIVKTTEQAVKCGDASKTIYTATFDQDADSSITEPFTIQKILYGNVIQHNWKYDTENVTWDVGNAKATITKTCNNKEHGDQGNGLSISSSKITTSPVSVTKCGEVGTIRYTATFDNTIDPDITNSFYVYKDVAGAELKHNWKIDSITSNATYLNQPSEVTINLVCIRDSSHTETVVTNDIKVVPDTDGVSKKYIYTGTTLDGQTITTEETVYSHIEHKWDVIFNWVGIPGLTRNTNGEIDTSATQNANYITVVDGKITITSTNLNYLLMDTHVIAEATCKKGGEKKEITVSIENKLKGDQIQYTAKATDPNGKEWKEYKSYNIKDGTIKDGPAGTPSVEGGDIVIIGLEESYPYTGTKIKPAITVMDGDVVLAQSTDYTVSYTGKNKIGEINKVEVKGKGNYAGKSATAKFKITDPRDAVDKDKLADKVSKVSVNNKKFIYNGRAQYPSEVTVTLKDKSTIVYKVDEDGNFTTESEKEVGLSFSNNINKGTATVAAMGSDGKVKKASYTIAAAEIASAEFEISAVDWAVKAATPEIKATIKLGDEDVELVAGQDYKVSFKAKEAGENKGTAKISGKGNFKGKHADVTYTVTTMEITESNIVVKAIAGKKAKDVKVIVNDAFGNALNKKFYTVEIQNAEGTALNKGDALTEEIKVVVKGANAAVTTGEDGVTVDVKPAADIAKVKGAFKVDKNFFKTYTGEPITLDADDFVSGKINVGTLELGKDFNIVAYKNNIKKGTMTVTVQGDGEYSGTKTFKVKIKAKPLDKVAPEN